MNIVFLGADLGVYPFPLRLLEANHNEVKIVSFQCKGDITADQCVKNADHALAVSKHSSFFNLAHERNADLAITPEYSTPWDVVDSILSGASPTPERGKIWVLGCESITPDELTELVNNHHEHMWVCDQPGRENDQVFYGISLYIFQAQHPEKKLCIVVQFKCTDMAGEFERDHLIKGSNRYILKNNSETSISLTTIICAESSEFQLQHISPLNSAYMILHPQMNSGPYQTIYKSYRHQIFNNASKFNITEIFSLNWANDSSIIGYGKVGGGSSYYMKPGKDSEPNRTSESIVQNHNKGLYFSYSESDRFYSYRLSGDELVFEFKATKSSQVDSSLNNQNKSGPKAIESYTWNNGWVLIDVCDDKIPKVLGENLTPIDREKVLTISTGRINKKPKIPKIPGMNSKAWEKELLPICWHTPENMLSLTLAEDELPRGTMVNLSSDTQGEDIDSVIQQFTYLKDELSNKDDHIPVVLSDFKNKEIEFYAVKEPRGAIRHNSHVKGSSNYAALVFLGIKGHEMAMSIHAAYKRILEPNRLVTWYRNANCIACLADNPRDIMDDEADLEDIAGER